MDADEKKFRDVDLIDLKNDIMETERASTLVQHDIDKMQKSIEDNGKDCSICFQAVLKYPRVSFKAILVQCGLRKK